MKKALKKIWPYLFGATIGGGVSLLWNPVTDVIGLIISITIALVVVDTIKEKDYPAEFIVWLTNEIRTGNIIPDETDKTYMFFGGEGSYFTLPELLSVWTDNVKGK